ncbi:Regulator of G-protein signaling 7 [Chytriomyces hyalinus]|nr:Regulator of G-protein signaling 7 [Chytriomyces hyalinus]
MNEQAPTDPATKPGPQPSHQQPHISVPGPAPNTSKLGLVRTNSKLGSSTTAPPIDTATASTTRVSTATPLPPAQSATAAGIFNFNSALSGTSSSSFKRRASTTQSLFQNIFGNSPLSENPDAVRRQESATPSTRVPGPVVPATPTVGISLPGNHEDEEEPKLQEPVAPKAELLKDLARTFGPEETTKKSIEARVNERRLMMVEEVVHRLRDPVSGVELKDRSKLFQVYKNSFTGTMLIDWLIPNCKLCGKTDGIRIAQTLMDYSYIVSVDMDYKFKEASLYIFQTSFLWPTVPWSNLGRDYFIYLIKRTQRSSKQQQLTVSEEQRLERLMLKFKKTRDEIAQAVKVQSEYTEGLSKNDKRIFFLQEHAFWKYQRPLQQTANTPSPTMKDDSTMRVRTFEEYLAQLTDAQLLVYVEKKVSQLQASNYMKRVPLSTASKSILERVMAFQPVDPFIEQLSENPFTCDDPKIWDASKTIPTPNDIKIWRRHTTELLNDPLGLKLFGEFLRKEDLIDALDLHIKIKSLDQISSYTEYVNAATEVFNEFIPIGSPREVALTFGIRTRLVATFTILKNQIDQQLAKLESQATTGTLASSAKERAAELPTVNLFQGAGAAASPSVGNLNGPSITNVSMADVTASMAGLSRMMTVTEGGASRPAILAHQYQQLQENKKKEALLSHPPTIDENKKSVSMAGDVATSAALTPERLATWRLPHDCFSAANQHILVILGRDAYSRFWASPPMKELMELVGVQEQT